MERARLLTRRLGRLLHALRNEMGLTQVQMAKRCSMSTKHYGELERGDVEASLGALACLAKALDCTVSELLAQVDDADHRSARPTLDLRTWERIRDETQLINDHARQMITYIERKGASQRPRE